MTKQASILFLTILSILAIGCQGNTKEDTTNGNPIPFKYAQLIKMWDFDDYKKLEIQDPWDSCRILQTYLLVDKSKKTPEHLPEGIIIRTPLEKSIVYTTVHCALIQELEAIKSIAGVCDLKYIQQTAIQEGCQRGEIADLGSSMGPDKEKIIEISPDAILLSPFENSGGHGELDKFGMPIFECADYMEKEPLGRAEWMRIYGMLYGKEHKADSIFNTIEKEFNQIQIDVQQDSTQRPSLLYGFKYGSAWYVPGGKSYMAKLFQSAGANYIFAHTEHAGSEPFAFETVFDKGFDTDIWIFLYNDKEDRTYKDLEEYSKFKAYKDKKIYTCNTGKIPYYDEVPFHPERLLHDLNILFHSKNKEIDCEKLHYYHNLAE